MADYRVILLKGQKSTTTATKFLKVFSKSHQRAPKRDTSESELGADGQRCESLNFHQPLSTVALGRLGVALAALVTASIPLHRTLSFISKVMYDPRLREMYSLFTHHSTCQRIAPQAYRHRTGALQ